jgi:hypothetical protein
MAMLNLGDELPHEQVDQMIHAPISFPIQPSAL